MRPARPNSHVGRIFEGCSLGVAPISRTFVHFTPVCLHRVPHRGHTVCVDTFCRLCSPACGLGARPRPAQKILLGCWPQVRWMLPGPHAIVSYLALEQQVNKRACWMEGLEVSSACGMRCMHVGPRHAGKPAAGAGCVMPPILCSSDHAGGGINPDAFVEGAAPFLRQLVIARARWWVPPGPACRPLPGGHGWLDLRG